MMKAYEITALPRWGDSCFTSSCPGEAVSVEFWGLSQGRGCGQSSGPVGLKGEGMSVKLSCLGLARFWATA